MVWKNESHRCSSIMHHASAFHTSCTAYIILYWYMNSMIYTSIFYMITVSLGLANIIAKYSIYVNITLIPKNFDRYPQWWSGKYISFPSWGISFPSWVYGISWYIMFTLFWSCCPLWMLHVRAPLVPAGCDAWKVWGTLGAIHAIFIAMKWTTLLYK